MDEISEDDLYVMASIYPDDSGLPMTVWVRLAPPAKHIARSTGRSNERHAPRIKSMLPEQTVTVTLPPTIRAIPPSRLPADDLHQLEGLIRLNETTIKAHWEGRISAIEFSRRLQTAMTDRLTLIRALESSGMQSDTAERIATR